MRGLNLISNNRQKGSNSWYSYQKQQLALQNEPALTVAFPGSLLCNHSLLPTTEKYGSVVSGFTLPDVSDVVYRYCSDAQRHPMLAGAVVVDLENGCDAEVVAQCVARQVDIAQATRVVVLGQVAYRDYSDAISHQCGEEINITTLEPDWMSAFALHSIYRQASSVLFVNTMRALDAACTGCRCSLIIGKQVHDEASFPIFYDYLSSCGWNLINETAQPITDSACPWSYLVVENNVHALQQALKQVAFPGDQDWLAGYSTGTTQQVVESGSVPIIKPYSSGRTRLVTGLRDKRTAIGRKAVKLRDDPAAFFSDSNNKVVRLVGRFTRKKL